MKQKHKLEEASYFLEQMILNMNEPQHFKFNFSAFLSATRSVLQYTFKDVHGTSSQSWYEQYIGKDISSFFKEIRNHNIHTEPIKNSKSIKITIPTIRYKTSFSGDDLESHKSMTVKEAEYKYFIRANADHFGDDYKNLLSEFKELLDKYDRNVIELSKKYLEDLYHFVSKGISNGHLK